MLNNNKFDVTPTLLASRCDQVNCAESGAVWFCNDAGIFFRPKDLHLTYLCWNPHPVIIPLVDIAGLQDIFNCCHFGWNPTVLVLYFDTQSLASRSGLWNWLLSLSEALEMGFENEFSVDFCNGFGTSPWHRFNPFLNSSHQKS
jgi:hypothetical protein